MYLSIRVLPTNTRFHELEIEYITDPQTYSAPPHNPRSAFGLLGAQISEILTITSPKIFEIEMIVQCIAEGAKLRSTLDMCSINE